MRTKEVEINYDNTKKKSRIFFHITMESENVKFPCTCFTYAFRPNTHRLWTPHVNATIIYKPRIEKQRRNHQAKGTNEAKPPS
jgi:hypothetical protein